MVWVLGGLPRRSKEPYVLRVVVAAAAAVVPGRVGWAWSVLGRAEVSRLLRCQLGGGGVAGSEQDLDLGAKGARRRTGRAVEGREGETGWRSWLRRR